MVYQANRSPTVRECVCAHSMEVLLGKMEWLSFRWYIHNTHTDTWTQSLNAHMRIQRTLCIRLEYGNISSVHTFKRFLLPDTPSTRFPNIGKYSARYIKLPNVVGLFLGYVGRTKPSVYRIPISAGVNRTTNLCQSICTRVMGERGWVGWTLCVQPID